MNARQLRESQPIGLLARIARQSFDSQPSVGVAPPRECRPVIRMQSFDLHCFGSMAAIAWQLAFWSAVPSQYVEDYWPARTEQFFLLAKIVLRFVGSGVFTATSRALSGARPKYTLVLASRYALHGS